MSSGICVTSCFILNGFKYGITFTFAIDTIYKMRCVVISLVRNNTHHVGHLQWRCLSFHPGQYRGIRWYRNSRIPCTTCYRMPVSTISPLSSLGRSIPSFTPIPKEFIYFFQWSISVFQHSYKPDCRPQAGRYAKSKSCRNWPMASRRLAACPPPACVHLMGLLQP